MGKPLDQRRLAKELKRYGIESQEVRIGAENRKGYVVAGDTGLAQAWRRYLTHVGVRDMGDIAGQSVADVSRTNHERDKRDTSATPETPPEHGLFESVADVADVAHIDGSRKGGPSVNGSRPPICPDCTRAPARTDTGVCDLCTTKQRAAEEAGR